LVTARDGVGGRKTVRVLGGAQPPYIGWKPETRTCPSPEPDMSGQNCPGSSENFGNYPKKLIFKGYWRRANRRYIYVAYGQVLTNIYIYIRLGTIQIIKHG
jgi:hypothetical protein